MKGSGECGTLYVAEPLDACSPLKNVTSSIKGGSKSPFVLIIRGGCSFEDKVRRAQTAGFKAAIVYDNEDGDLVASKFPIPMSTSVVDLFLFSIFALYFMNTDFFPPSPPGGGGVLY